MVEIAALPKNGLKVASTFSGCGGSSLGYKMAGFDVVYANEFIPAAQDSYAANFPSTFLDKRDIREVKPEDILKATGLRKGELDILDGSPPCAAFSTAGSREKGWGEIRKYSDTKQRVDDLFFEYVRILRGVQPKVFVAENVAGLVIGKAKGYFLEILSELRAAGYKVTAKVLDAKWLGVPQSRNRLIFVGVREDLKVEPAHPEPFKYQYSIHDAFDGKLLVEHDTSGTFSQGVAITISGNAAAFHFKVQDREAPSLKGTAIGVEAKKLGKGKQSGKYFNLIRPSSEKPSPAILSSHGGRGVAGVLHPSGVRKFTIEELRIICSFPADFVLTGSYEKQWERLGRAVPPLMMRAVASTLRDQVFPEIAKRCAE